MLDFAALPPEVNSTMIYTGPGSGPMMAAATAWNAVAAQWDSVVASYATELTSLQGQSWSGAASDLMAAAAVRFITWAAEMAALAEQAAAQARAAGAAFEAAHAATVPPEAVAANRSLLAMLVATNFFGQNALAIAATEALYAEMWAQDAAAMYGYLMSSLHAAALTSFKAPPKTTNPSGQSAQSAATAHALGTAAAKTSTALSHAFPTASHATTPGATPSSGSATPTGYYYITDWSSYKHVYDIFDKALFSPFANKGVTIGDAGAFVGTAGMFGRHLALPATPPALLGEGALTGSTGAAAPTGAVGTAGTNGGAMLASAGRAASVGTLSVPQSWTTAAPAAKAGYLAQAPASASPRAVPAELVRAATPAMDQTPPALGPIGGSERQHGNSVFRMRDRRFRMPRYAAGG